MSLLVKRSFQDWPIGRVSMQHFFVGNFHLSMVVAWSVLVEGDEQLDRHKNQTSMSCMLHYFGVCHKHSSLPLGPVQSSYPSTKELHSGAQMVGVLRQSQFKSCKSLHLYFVETSTQHFKTVN